MASSLRPALRRTRTGGLDNVDWTFSKQMLTRLRTEPLLFSNQDVSSTSGPFFSWQDRPQLIQSTAFNLSLDKQQRIRYLLVKVRLTVSPLRPSSSPQPGVYPQPFDFAHPLFSWSYELLFSQLLYFQNHLRCPMFFGSLSSDLCVLRPGTCPDSVGVVKNS
jgi:hypothetical protein